MCIIDWPLFTTAISHGKPSHTANARITMCLLIVQVDVVDLVAKFWREIKEREYRLLSLLRLLWFGVPLLTIAILVQSLFPKPFGCSNIGLILLLSWREP
jgi:hypothetical protein